jgi:hypothetical protein
MTRRAAGSTAGDKAGVARLAPGSQDWVGSTTPTRPGRVDPGGLHAYAAALGAAASRLYIAGGVEGAFSAMAAGYGPA